MRLSFMTIQFMSFHIFPSMWGKLTQITFELFEVFVHMGHFNVSSVATFIEYSMNIFCTLEKIKISLKPKFKSQTLPDMKISVFKKWEQTFFSWDGNANLLPHFSQLNVCDSVSWQFNLWVFTYFQACEEKSHKSHLNSLKSLFAWATLMWAM